MLEITVLGLVLGVTLAVISPIVGLITMFVMTSKRFVKKTTERFKATYATVKGTVTKDGEA